MNKKDTITTSQVVVIISSFMIADGYILAARNAADKVGNQDIWISMLLGGILSLLAGIICARLSLRFQGETLYQFSKHIVGKPLGILVSLNYIVAYTLSAGYEARITSEFVRHYLLDQTPIEIIMIPFIGVGIYLLWGGINPMARLMALLYPPSFILIVCVMLICLQNFDLANLRPMLSEGLTPVLKGVYSTFFGYAGFETIVFLTAVMDKPRKAVKAVLLGVLMPLVLYVFNVIIVVGTFTVKEVKTLTWPTMEVTRRIEFLEGFFENIEVLFFIIWIIQFFTTYIASQYFASLGIGQLLNIPTKYLILGLTPIIYCIALYPSDINGVFKLSSITGIFWSIGMGAIPLVLWLITILKERMR